MDNINKLSIKFKNRQILVGSQPEYVLYRTNPKGTKQNILSYFIDINIKTRFREPSLKRLIKRFGDFDWFE